MIRNFLLVFWSLICLISADDNMKLHLLSDGVTVCNDNSPAGYYIRYMNSTKWVIYLQGGAFCFDDKSCDSRWKETPFWMSSLPWPPFIQGTGILSSNEKHNPHWWDANSVYLGYCSSDSWSGSAVAPSTSKWSFLGSKIVPAIVQDLLSNWNLKSAKDVLFTGESAGAEGLLVHADNIAKMLSFARFRTLVDSGWFLDFEPFKPQPCNDAFSCTEQGCLQRGSKIWKPKPDVDCEAAKTADTLWECILGYRAYPFIQTPLFIMVFRFDSAQMAHDAIFTIPETTAEMKYAQEAAKNLTATFSQVGVTTVFNPSCYFHTVETSSRWNVLQIDGVILSDAVWEWYQNPLKKSWYIDNCTLPNCNPTCPE